MNVNISFEFAVHYHHFSASSQVLDTSQHFGGKHNFINENQSFDDISDRLISGVENDARMIHAFAGKAKKILIARDDHSAFIARKAEMGNIILRSQTCFVCSCYVDSRTA